MLTKFRKSAAVCAIALGLSAQSAAAVEHEVLIVDGAYFPSLIIAETGDTLVFVNVSSDIHEVKAIDDSWTSGVMGIGDTYSLALEPQITLSFTATGDTEGQGGEDGDLMLEQVGSVVWNAGGNGGNGQDGETQMDGTN